MSAARLSRAPAAERAMPPPANLRQPLHHQLQGIAACADRLATMTRGWPAFAPRPAVLDDAIIQAEGLARALRELHATMRSDAQR